MWVPKLSVDDACPEGAFKHDVAEFFLEVAGIPEPLKVGISVLDWWDGLGRIWTDAVECPECDRGGVGICDTQLRSQFCQFAVAFMPCLSSA